MNRLVQNLGGFAIHQIVTHRGRHAYRVSGSVNGRQLRKQFTAELPALEWAAIQAKAKSLEQIAPEVTTQLLSPAQQVDARAALLELEKAQHQVSLLSCVQFYLLHHRAVKPITLGSAVAKYGADREREFETGTLSASQSRSIAKELARCARTFGPETALTAVTRDQVQSYLTNRTDEAQTKSGYSNKTFNNRRSLLVHFFGWCIDHGHASRNPAKEIKGFRRVRSRNPQSIPAARILTAKQARELMEHVRANHEARLVPYFALALLASVRPDWKYGELARFDATYIRLEKNVIHLPGHLTKTGKPRHVVIQPNLKQWLLAYPLERYPLKPANFRKLLKRTREKFELGHNVLRHTYVSMIAGKYRSVGEAALQAGNSEEVVWSNYLDLVDESEAARFWEIAPAEASDT